MSTSESGSNENFLTSVGVKEGCRLAPVTLPDEFIISGNLTLWIIWIIQHQLGSRDIFTFLFNLVKSFGWQALWIFQRISGKSKVSSFGLRARYEIFTGGKRPRRINKGKQKKLSFLSKTAPTWLKVAIETKVVSKVTRKTALILLIIWLIINRYQRETEVFSKSHLKYHSS